MKKIHLRLKIKSTRGVFFCLLDDARRKRLIWLVRSGADCDELVICIFKKLAMYKMLERREMVDRFDSASHNFTVDRTSHLFCIASCPVRSKCFSNDLVLSPFPLTSFSSLLN